ncbi:hypothetical protein IWC96_05860 [Brevundimonas sp. BAL450]|jgi:hypothetical protein|uniref:Uncharacterized protein n=1 Tax=Brevundimonas abyssalis TAR-001 TaxID=1391729 RepID=A0A8E0NB09_9CAUL|nr:MULTISPECIES: hypothetical protein [Brevundimonas]MBG7614807.1 hypothetical protein [Brevundimonas sp. BAL450]GAD58392.1 hypothetical protein MBEBAB_0642 [Brevundimonas abyssalis TAR-001]
MDPKLIENLANRPRVGMLALFLWRATWLVGVAGTLGFLGAAVALGVFGVGGHDLGGRIALGAMLAFMGLMMFAIGSLARLLSGQLKAALIARCGDAPRVGRRWAPCP